MTTLDKSKTAHAKKLIEKSGSGYLPTDLVQSLTKEFNCSVEELMLMLLPIAKEYSVAPISKFTVGAIALGTSGSLYLGANQELSQVSLTQVVHSEQSAIANAHRLDEPGITKIAVSERPCGHCRQFLCELSNNNDVEVLLATSPARKLSELLPDAFDTTELGVKSSMLLPQDHSLELTCETSDDLTEQAWAAAENSYAPYTKAYSGAALQIDDGKVFSGSYLESVAFNPSLGAMQSALVGLVLSGYTYENIKSAVLVLVKDSVINHVETAQIILKSVRPEVHLNIYEVV